MSCRHPFTRSADSLSLLPTEQQTVVLLPHSPSAAKTYFPIPVEHLEEEFRLRSADDGKLFREEYNVSGRLAFRTGPTRFSLN